MALVHDPELLTSEQRAFERWRPLLVATSPRAVLVDATDEEVALARAYFAGTAPPTAALPAAWTGAPVVIVVELFAPTGVKPKRRTSGLGGLAVFRPPSTEPILIRRVDDPASTSSAGLDTTGAWIARTVTLVAGSPP